MKKITVKILMCIVMFLAVMCMSNLYATTVDSATMEQLQKDAQNIDMNNISNEDLLKVYDQMSEKYSNDDIAKIIDENKDAIKSQGVSDKVIDTGKEILKSTDSDVIKEVIKSNVDVNDIQEKIQNGYTPEQIVKSTVKEMPTEQKVNIATKLAFGNTYIKAVIAIIVFLFVFRTVCLWRIYQKAGKYGWATLIPIYRNVVMYQICDLSPLLMLLWLLPILGWIAMIAIWIMRRFELSKSFGKGFFFGCGLWILPNLFEAILAFSKMKYVDRNEEDESELEVENDSEEGEDK